MSTLSAWPPADVRAICMPAMLMLGLAELLAVDGDDAGTVVVDHDDVVLGDRHLDVVAVDLDDLLDLLRAGQRARDRDLRAVGERAAQGDAGCGTPR